MNISSCKICGNADQIDILRSRSTSFRGERNQVICHGCGCQGPLSEEHEVIERWNKLQELTEVDPSAINDRFVIEQANLFLETLVKYQAGRVVCREGDRDRVPEVADFIKSLLEKSSSDSASGDGININEINEFLARRKSQDGGAR